MNRKLIIVGAIAILAFGATFLTLRGGANPPPSPAAEAPPKVDVEQVLVASQDLPMGAVVNEGATGWQTWPKAAVSELMITKSGKPDALKDAEGSMTRTAFLRGEPIRHDKLVKAGAGRIHIRDPAERKARGRDQDRQQRRFDGWRIHSPQ
jgi:pilus assembly protein CpaB